jgi:CBS domain-containing protein
VENGAINTWVIEQEPNVIERVMVATIQKRTSALKEAKKMEEVYGFLPVLLLRESDALAQIKVEEIMTKNIKTVPCDITVSQILDLIAKYHHIGYPVINENGEPIGTVTLEEASKVEKTKRKDTLVGHITRRELIVAYPGETALDAFKRMSEHETGRILVLDSANPKKLLGMITKTDLMHILVNNIENMKT